MPRDFHKNFLSRIKKAITAFGMLEHGDRVAVGVSGGKDSITLLHVLTMVGRSAPVKFELEAVYIDLGWSVDTSSLSEFCHSRGVALHVIKMDITSTLFGDKPAENPCALCSHLRRGVLHSKALELDCNKVALGHHLDDVIETYMMNLLYNGQIRTFSPCTYLDRTGLTMIRPLVYIPLEDIYAWVAAEKLPVLANPCPANGHTKRDEARRIVSGLSENHPDFRSRFLNALLTFDQSNLWPASRKRVQGPALAVRLKEEGSEGKA